MVIGFQENIYRDITNRSAVNTEFAQVIPFRATAY